MTTIQPNVAQAATPISNLSFDEDGFLIDSYAWTREGAQIMAEVDGIGPLSRAHWKVISFLRDRFSEVGGLPAMRAVCKASDLQPEEVKALFGSCCEAWRLAGLPNPGEEARAYMACMS
jgi:tRNA 2-thiouridine synthesizing protein E